MIVSPIDSYTTGGPAVKIDACRLITLKSDIGATSAPWPGGCAEHRGDERDASGAARLREHVGRGSRVALAVGPEAGAFQHHDQRHPVGDRDLRDAVPLRVRRLADRAGLDREVLGRDHHRPALDATGAHHDRVGRRVVAADERAELLERTGIEQVVDAGADVELARGAVLRQPLLAAHRSRRDPALLELLEDFVPASELSDRSSSTSASR